ncbi:MAG TPA: PAS domain-containing protein [Planctomycetaceae bacterium]|nr:PAS domain-containing protein [Planctomycetaceae bacterium]
MVGLARTVLSVLFVNGPARPLDRFAPVAMRRAHSVASERTGSTGHKNRGPPNRAVDGGRMAKTLPGAGCVAACGKVTTQMSGLSVDGKTVRVGVVVTAAAALSGLVGLGSGGGWSAAGVAVGASVTTSLVTWGLIARWAQRAADSLRQASWSSATSRREGPFGRLIDVAAEHVRAIESRWQREVRHRLELEALAQARSQKVHRLEMALRALETPVLVTDSEDRILYVNPAALRLFGRGEKEGADEALNNLDLAALPALRDLILETRLRASATRQRSSELELIVGGEVIAYRGKAVNVYADGGVHLGVVTVLSEIRDERLAKTRHAEFVSAVSHEMKTPLASIKAFIEMLMDGDVADPEEQQELYGFIDAQVDRLTRMINSMLNLARIESGVIKIQRQDCELNEQLEKAANVVRPVAEEKQIRFFTELSELYLPVHVDPELFGQAMINLLSNAVKYTPAGGEVRLRSRMDEDHATIEVRDTGMGIPEDSLPHIFDRFYRVPENKNAASGTGLGLALVHYIITDIHSGSISVTSKVNEGTCFTLRLPLGHLEPKRKTDRVLCSA